jgi:poly(3-hydroxybutyrate) depolymerase
MTVEGENDDISGVGQTKAAHTLCINIPDERRAHWMQPKVGHYGVFNGSRFRAEIAPRMKIFIEASSQSGDMAAKPDKTSVQKRGPGRLKLVESIS